MTLAYISAGSNLGDRFASLTNARRMLQETQGIARLRTSPCFETDPEGTPEPQPKFLNAVWEIETELTPQRLREILHELENQMGRERPYPNAPRTLDLDLLAFGDVILKEENLTLPHPRLRDRLFVLKPLAILAPKWKDPETGTTADKLLEAYLESHPPA